MVDPAPGLWLKPSIEGNRGAICSLPYGTACHKRHRAPDSSAAAAHTLLVWVTNSSLGKDVGPTPSIPYIPTEG